MEWLNIHTSTLDSPEFLGATPTERATWLCLLRYCIGQENGGLLADCKKWGNRKWQQLCRVTLKEVQSASDLWTWDGDTLALLYYPSDKEKEVQNFRARGSVTSEKKANAARINGAKGGRPKNPTGNQTENPTETDIKPIEGKGREGKGREGNAGENPPPAAGLTSGPMALTELTYAGARMFGREDRAAWARLCEFVGLAVVMESVGRIRDAGEQPDFHRVKSCVEGSWTPKVTTHSESDDGSPPLTEEQIAYVVEMERELAEKSNGEAQ